MCCVKSLWVALNWMHLFSSLIIYTTLDRIQNLSLYNKNCKYWPKYKSNTCIDWGVRTRKIYLPKQPIEMMCKWYYGNMMKELNNMYTKYLLCSPNVAMYNSLWIINGICFIKPSKLQVLFVVDTCTSKSFSMYYYKYLTWITFTTCIFAVLKDRLSVYSKTAFSEMWGNCYMYWHFKFNHEWIVSSFQDNLYLW